jgi:hypothetical protein
MESTAPYRQIRERSTRFVWEVDPALTGAEQAAVQALGARVGELFLAEVEARKLTAEFEAFLVQRSMAGEPPNLAGARVTASGVMRLEPQERLKRFRSLARMMLAMSDAECRQWAGADAAVRTLYFLSTVDDADLAEHVRWQATALEAGLRATRPEVELSEEELTDALLAIVENLGDEVGPATWSALTQFEALPPSAQCWVERRMLEGVLAATPDEAPDLATAYLKWSSEGA